MTMIRTYLFAVTAAMLFLSDTAMAKEDDSQTNPLGRAQDVHNQAAPIPDAPRIRRLAVMLEGDNNFVLLSPALSQAIREAQLNAIANGQPNLHLSPEQLRELNAAMHRASEHR